MRSEGKHYAHITSATTTQVKVGNSRLVRILVNKPVNSTTITVIDGDGTTNSTVGIITNLATAGGPYFIDFDLLMKNGVRITTSGADDVTVVYE